LFPLLWILIALVPARSGQARRTVVLLVLIVSALGIGYGFYQYFREPEHLLDDVGTEEERTSMLQLILFLLAPGAIVAFIRLLFNKPDRT
jgi:disulfide bond formation protein DsbB